MKDFKKILGVFAFTTFVIIALGFLTSNATAQDCDDLSGAAYGLCIAYCEAMDCDGSEPDASQAACDKVLVDFTEIVGSAPPCACGPELCVRPLICCANDFQCHEFCLEDPF